MAKKQAILRAVQDKILVIKTKSGDEKAYGELFSRYFKDIFAFLYLKVSSTEIAEDLASEAFLKVWQYIKIGKPVDNIRALLYRTARNLIIDHHRKKKNVSLSFADASLIPDARANIIERIERNEQGRALQDALGKLKEEYRDALILRYTQELSYKEIGKILGKRSGAARVIVYRAQKELKKKLEGTV